LDGKLSGKRSLGGRKIKHEHSEISRASQIIKDKSYKIISPKSSYIFTVDIPTNKFQTTLTDLELKQANVLKFSMQVVIDGLIIGTKSQQKSNVVLDRNEVLAKRYSNWFTVSDLDEAK